MWTASPVAGHRLKAARGHELDGGAEGVTYGEADEGTAELVAEWENTRIRIPVRRLVEG